MAVESPGDLEVSCDVCGEAETMEVTEYGGSPYTFGVDDATAREHGWHVEGSYYTCPECREDDDDE